METGTWIIVCLLTVFIIGIFKSRWRRTPSDTQQSENLSEETRRDRRPSLGSEYIYEEPESVSGRKGHDLELKKDRSARAIGPVNEIEFDKFRTFVKEDALREEMKKEGNLNGLDKYIKDSLPAWNKIELNVGITGNSGVGKSSLINALMRLKPTDKGAAAVDVVETTIEASRYPHPENEHVVFWDLPGIGTQTFTKESYLEKIDFKRFEVIMIVSAGRFLENDMWLAKNLINMKKNVMFVRTKIDFDVSNAMRDNPDSFNEITCLKKIKDNISKNIQVGGIPDLVSGIYLVSSPERTKYDFPILDTNLSNMLSIKGKAIRGLLQKPLEQAIEVDKRLCKDEYKISKMAVSVIVGFLPLPKLDIWLYTLFIHKIRNFCLQKFCIDDSSLDKLAKELKVQKTVLTVSLQSYLGDDQEQGINIQVQNEIQEALRNKYLLPIIGFFLSVLNIYDTLGKCMKTMCEEMAADELTLIRYRLDRLEEKLRPI